MPMLEAALERELGLVPRALPAELAAASGTLRGAPVQLHTRAWTGPAFRHVRVARLTGPRLAIVNLLALPEVDRDLPVLGADVVWLGKDDLLLAVDLTPTGACAADVPRAELPPAGALPGWAERIFSREAVFARVPSSGEGAVREVIDARIHALAALARASGPGPSFAAAQDRYLRAHLEDERLLGPLRAAFGAEHTARYVREVLFPSAIS
jgi:hypothetical protein